MKIIKEKKQKMLKRLLTLIFVICLSVCLSGCIYLETPLDSSNTGEENTTFIKDANSLKNAFLTGGEYVLTENVSIVDAEVLQGIDVTLNLNGQKIIASNPVAIKNAGTLKVHGNGVVLGAIENTGILILEKLHIEKEDVFVVNKGQLVVNSGTFVCTDAGGVTPIIENTGNMQLNGGNFISASMNASVITSNGDLEINKANVNGQFCAIASTGGSVVINSGVFSATQNYALSLSGATARLNGGTFVGGLASEYDIAVEESTLFIGGKAVIPTNRIKADKNVFYLASNQAEVLQKLNDGYSVVLDKDVKFVASSLSEGVMAGFVHNGGTVDGGGNVAWIDGASEENDIGFYTAGGTLKNITVSGGTCAIMATTLKEDLILDGVTVKNSAFAFRAEGEKSEHFLKVQNSSLFGWTSFADIFAGVTFENCTFGYGAGYQYCCPYTATEFKNCTFEEDFAFDARYAQITFENCYYGEVLITAENAVELLGAWAEGINFVTEEL